MDTLRVSILQTNIVWEDKTENLRLLRHKLQSLRGETEIVVLPEMFSTGFSMQSHQLAEPDDGNTLCLLRRWAAEFELALCGSHIGTVDGRHYNRAFFLTPQGKAYFYNKRHLFSMGGEATAFAPGTERLVVPYRGWNICLLVCYDLRFPVWSRNTGNAYDLLVYVANWPASRRTVWDTLLRARALENQCYVCGVNRVGTDGHGLTYDGGSALYDAYAHTLAAATDRQEECLTATLSLSSLQGFREKFPVWKDADTFRLTEAPATNVKNEVRE